MNNAKKKRKTAEWERLAILSRKLEIIGNISREGTNIPLQYSSLENPMDGGAW